MGDAIREQVKTYRDVDVSNTTPTNKARVWVNTSTNDTESQDILLPQVDDANISEENTWSSKKIDSEIGHSGSILNKLIDLLTNQICESQEPIDTIDSTFLTTDGTVIPSEDEHWVTNVYDVEPCTDYLVNCAYGWDAVGIVYYTESGETISFDYKSSNGVLEKGVGIITTPYNCKRIKMTGYVNASGITKIYQYLGKVSYMLTQKGNLFKKIDLEWDENKYYSGETWKKEDYNFLETAEIPVECGETYMVSGCSYYDARVITLLYKNTVIGKYPENKGVTNFVSQIITIPENCNKMIVNGIMMNESSDERIWSHGVIPTRVWKLTNSDIKPPIERDITWVAAMDSLTDSKSLSMNEPNYVEFVASVTGVKCVNMGVGGTGYIANNSGYGKAFYERVSEIPDNADIITLFGSFNDIYQTDNIGTIDSTDLTTIAGCINKTITDIFSTHPDIIVGIISPTPWGACNRITVESDKYQKSLDYVNLLESIAKKYSLPYLDLFNHSGLRPWDSSFVQKYYRKNDTVHVNSEGHRKFIAPKIAHFVESLIELN